MTTRRLPKAFTCGWCETAFGIVWTSEEYDQRVKSHAETCDQADPTHEHAGSAYIIVHGPDGESPLGVFMEKKA
jgi:hypothetical protein